jgi:transposase
LGDDLERQIAEINRRLKEGHAEHPYVPLLLTVPGIGSVLAFTIAAEIGEIERFPSPEKLAGYTGLCPRVNQSGEKDRRGPLTKHGPTYLRWALLEATMHALRHPAYAERYQKTKRRLGKHAQRQRPQARQGCTPSHDRRNPRGCTRSDRTDLPRTCGSH